jgi:hypothetical protein
MPKTVRRRQQRSRRTMKRTVFHKCSKCNKVHKHRMTGTKRMRGG